MSTARGMKTLPVCEGCRMRKVRCDSLEQGCHQCRETGINCVRTPAIRFKDVTGQKSMTFTSQQVWISPSAQLRYYDETPELADFYQRDSPTTLQGERSRPFYDETAEVSGHAEMQISVPDSRAPSNVYRQQSTNEPASDARGAFTQPSEHQLSPNAGFGILSETSPATNSQTKLSPWTGQSLESDSTHSYLQSTHTLSESEALLLRNYTENMALWADGPDPYRSFELEASRIALIDPILRHAICTFSSRHMNRNHASRDAEALEHQDLCLQLLIPAMSGQQPVSEGVLAAVAILRQNEEMDEYDNRFHLEGVTRILNDVSAFASSGGLNEATAWLCLREDIYVSLTTQTAIRTNLAPFESATWIQGESDTSWANQMVLLLAKLLSVAFLEAADPSILTDIQARISTWGILKPYSFKPVYFLPRYPAAGRNLPAVWMLAPPQAIGLQYYYISQLVLAVSTSVSSARPFDRIHEHRAVERQVRHHLLHVVGIARSNPRAQNTWFTAHHCLAVWGGCLRKKGDQEACLSFLEDMERQIGWRVGRLMEELKAHWEDDSD